MNMLRFSLIVCTRDRPHLLENLLLGIGCLRYPEFELIVIHDPNDSSTAQCIAQYAPGAKLGYCTSANLAKSRNIGLAMASGDIAAFIDDDAVPEADWLDRLAGCYARPEIMAAGGFIRAQNGIKFQSRVVFVDLFGADHHRAGLAGPTPAGWFLSLTGTNFSVRRNRALALGGFDENYPYFLEETDFLYRLCQAGGEVFVTDQAEVHHGFAASAMRGPANVPKSLRVIACSKAYFCHVNRQPGISPSAIHRALARFAVTKTWAITSSVLSARLSAGNAMRLFTELKIGLREGEALATSGRSLPVFTAGTVLKFAPFQPQPAPRQRLCVLMTTTPDRCPQWQQIRELAYKDYDVTVIYFGTSIFPRVGFVDGIWQHRLSVAWKLVFRSAHAITAELQRISAHRQFEKIYVTANDSALQKAAAASGLPIFLPRP